MCWPFQRSPTKDLTRHPKSFAVASQLIFPDSGNTGSQFYLKSWLGIEEVSKRVHLISEHHYLPFSLRTRIGYVVSWNSKLFFPRYKAIKR